MLDKELENNLNEIFKLAQKEKHEFVTVDHLLLSLMFNNDARSILESCGVDPE